MKKALFLALLSVPLVLTACVKNRNVTTTGTTSPGIAKAPTASPMSVTGKTLIAKSPRSGVRTYVFSQGSNTAKTIDEGMPYRAVYEKTGARTAQITISPWMPVDSGFKYVKLIFSGAKSGAYRMEVETCSDGSEPNRVVDSGSFIIR